MTDDMREWADLHGYTYKCPGCGQLCDSPAGCGCFRSEAMQDEDFDDDVWLDQEKP
jgi:hypothetical protein